MKSTKSTCDYIANAINHHCSCQDIGSNTLKFKGISDTDMEKAIKQVQDIRKQNQALMNENSNTPLVALVKCPSKSSHGAVFILYVSRNGVKSNATIKAVSTSFIELVQDVKTYIDSITKTYHHNKIEIRPVSESLVSKDEDDLIDVVIDDTAHFILSIDAIEDKQDLELKRGPLKITTLKEYSMNLYCSLFYETIMYGYSIKDKNQKVKTQEPTNKNEKIDKALKTMWEAYAYLQEIKASLNS